MRAPDLYRLRGDVSRGVSIPQAEGKCDKLATALIQRDDDKEETITNRLANYNKATAPLLDYYRKHGEFPVRDGFRGDRVILCVFFRDSPVGDDSGKVASRDRGRRGARFPL